MKKRDSNLELMRVVLMGVIPAYHMLVYNLILKAPYNDATLVTLLFCAAGAIPANYAFMAMSSYFLLDTGGERSLQKFLSTGALAVTLFVVRFAVVRTLFGFGNTEYMIEGFITKGAWWYMDAYLVLLLCYPFLNFLMKKISRRAHGFLIAALFFLLVFFFAEDKMLFAGDLTAFSLIYVLMGYLKKSGYRRFLFLKTKRAPMLLGALVCYLLLFAAGFYAKWPAFGVDQGVGNDIAQYMISRYNVLALVMGVCLFFFFKALRVAFCRVINRIAACTVYVFLLHETLLSVFWYFGYLWFPMQGRPGRELTGWIILFTVSSFVLAFAARPLYETTVKKLWDRLIGRIRKTKAVRKLEEIEEKL